MFEKFTERARDAIIGATQTAEKYKHPMVRPIHLLSSLLSDDGIAGYVLRDVLQIDPDTLDEWLTEEGTMDFPAGTQLPFSEDLKRVMTQASQESVIERAMYIGPEHLLLGLVAGAWQGRISAYFRAQNVGSEQIVAAVREQIAKGDDAPLYMPWKITDVELGSVWVRDERYFEVVGVITDPVVVLRPMVVEEGMRLPFDDDSLDKFMVIKSQVFAEFSKLMRQDKPDA